VSLEAVAWVLNDAPDLPAHCVGVMVGLANHADPDGKGAFAAQGRLSGYSRKTDRQVRRDLEQLESLGLIRRGDQRLVAHIPADKRPIVWDLAMDRRIEERPVDVTDPYGVDEPVDNSKRPDARVRADVHDRTPTTGRRSPGGRKRPDAHVPPDIDDRTSMAERPDVHVLQTVLEPKATTTTSRASADAAAPQTEAQPRQRKPDPLARFDEFWKIYPKKKAPDAAKKAFAKAVSNGADPQAIIDGAIAYALECRMKEPQYVKYAQGWLNDGRWQDEPDRPPAPPSAIGAPSEAAAVMPPPVSEVLARQASYGSSRDPWTTAPDDPFYEPPF
jgi:hypothetical protein